MVTMINDSRVVGALPCAAPDSVRIGMDSVRIGMDSVRIGMDSVRIGIDSVRPRGAVYVAATPTTGVDAALFGTDLRFVEDVPGVLPRGVPV